MSGGWFYYEGDDRPKPTAEQRAAADGAERDRSGRLGPRQAQISIDIYEEETTMTMGFGGGRMTPDEVRYRSREIIARAIGELRRHL
ncbi:MAG TPA: hypothetical protein VFN68_17115 [Acidimicrobiales bacterium]|nr:hypothetical protein [Acidimicrobiales bacterium]